MKKRYIMEYVKIRAAADLAAQDEENKNPRKSVQFNTLIEADSGNRSQSNTLPDSNDTAKSSGSALPASKINKTSILKNTTLPPKITVSKSNITTTATPKNITLPLKISPLSKDPKTTAIHIMTSWDSFMKTTLAQSETQPEHVQNFLKRYELSATEGAKERKETPEENVSSPYAEKETSKQKPSPRICITFDQLLKGTCGIELKRKTENTKTSTRATEDCSTQNKNNADSVAILNSREKQLGAGKYTEMNKQYSANMPTSVHNTETNLLHHPYLHPPLPNLENKKQTDNTQNYTTIQHPLDTVLQHERNTVNVDKTTYRYAPTFPNYKKSNNVTTFDFAGEQNSQEEATIVSSQYFQENLLGQKQTIENIYNSLCLEKASQNTDHSQNLQISNTEPAEERLHELVNVTFDNATYLQNDNQYETSINNANYLSTPNKMLNTKQIIKQDENNPDNREFHSNEAYENAILRSQSQLKPRKTDDKVLPNNAREESESRSRAQHPTEPAPRNIHKLIGVVTPDMERLNRSLDDREHSSVQKSYNQSIDAIKAKFLARRNITDNRNVYVIMPNKDEENKCAKKIMDRRRSARLATIEKKFEDSSTTNNANQENSDNHTKESSAKAARSAQIQAKEEELFDRFQETLMEIKDIFKNTGALINHLYVSNLRTSNLFANILKQTKVIAGKGLKRKLSQFDDESNVDSPKKLLLHRETVEKRTALDSQTKEEKPKCAEYEVLQPQQTKLLLKRKSEPEKKDDIPIRIKRKPSPERRQSENYEAEDLIEEEIARRKARQEQLYKRLADLKNKNKRAAPDKTDTRWTLKYTQKGPGLVELVKNSGVFVRSIKLQDCLRRAQGNCRALARLLIKEVFTEKALIRCTPPGNKKIEGKLILDERALSVLLQYIVRDIGKRKDWLTAPKIDVVKSIRYVMYHMKAKAYLRNP